ncbi:DUF5677 domain-containing protein [Paenibacillus contaminans]|uniref:Uncharacterized protein n=1 Tax=Paenibacillus contaminans TaxID=450362 RepID=A0A329MI00_9BACL|nr:DUF5677 domain-containing protein [Paenibacillus contaminans]RAV19475.1 hypothetical protein DQG23_21020 [Paenibacillus contaminans]
MNNQPLIDEGEKIIEGQLMDEMQLHLIGCKNCCNVIAKSIEAFPVMDVNNVTSSIKVVTSLLAKILNDLRAASILSARGYSIQAATLASSLYESAFMIAYIGNNNDLADKWINHEDPSNLFISVKKLTEQGLKNINAPNYKELSEREYNNYRQLCMVKHGNPLIQKNHVYSMEGNSVVAIFGPETSEPSIRVSWFALENAINYSMIALSSYINCHLQTKTSSEIFEQFDDLKEVYKELHKKAVERWGNENPLPEL